MDNPRRSKRFQGNKQINANSIFLPAAGWRGGTSFYDLGSNGHYWSATPFERYTSSAYYLSFLKNYRYTNFYYRECGYSVRPVFQNN